MRANRKPSSLAVLKNLSEDLQAEVYRRCNLPADKDGGYTNVRKWLADDGVTTSEAALSEFWSWYGLQQQLKRNESTVETLLEDLSREKYTPEQIQELGQMFFSKLALDSRDPDVWRITQTLALKKEQLKFDWEKFTFDAAQACLKKLPELKAISDAPKLSPDEKAKAIQQILFPK